MNKEREKKLREAGFAVGDYGDFLGLTDEERAYIELRASLVRAIRERRKKELKISQAKFAERIGSSQSRVAKMEAGDPTVSFDLIMKSLVLSGSTAADIGQVIAQGTATTTAGDRPLTATNTAGS